MDKGGAPAGDHDAANKVARARDCRGVHAGEVGRDEKDDAQEAGEEEHVHFAKMHPGFFR